MNSSRCPISLCDISPSACQSEVTPSEAFALLALMVLPVAVAWLAPLFGARCVPCSERRDDDDPSLHDADPSRRLGPRDSTALSPLRAGLVPFRERVDPPMFLCGIGACPLDCGSTGLLAVVLAMVVGVYVIFFGLLFGAADAGGLDSAHEAMPCDGGLGACRTISCICGNVIPEGYVFMFTCLFLTSAVLVQRFSAMGHRHRPQHLCVKSVLVAGSLLLLLTAIFPERYDADGQLLSQSLEALHLLGVMGSGTLLMFVPYGWFVVYWRTHREEVPLRSVAARSCLVCMALALGVSMQVFGSAVADAPTNLCAYQPDAASCEAFPALPDAQR